MALPLRQTDYTQWERKAGVKQPFRSTGKPTNKQAAAAAEASGYGRFSISSDQLSRVGSACSLSKCQHPWNNFRAMEAERNAREKKRARMKELNVKIQLYEKSLSEIKQREAEIMRNNLDLFHQIESEQGDTVAAANNALNKYHRSRKGISVMKLRFERQRRELEIEVKDLQRTLATSTKKLKSEVAKVSQQVKEVYSEVALLNNYKDKVYPERLVLIHELRQQLDNQKLNNEEEEAELVEIIQAEQRKLQAEDAAAMSSMKSNVAQSALSEMHPSQIAMANENCKISKDIEFHQKVNSYLMKEIRELESSIEALKSDADCSVIKSMFPNIFQHQQMQLCQPDTELEFDIPQRKLPVI